MLAGCLDDIDVVLDLGRRFWVGHGRLNVAGLFVECMAVDCMAVGHGAVVVHRNDRAVVLLRKISR